MRREESTGGALITAPTLWALLERRAGRTPGHPMLVDDAAGRTLGFAEVRDHVLGLARWLHQRGVGPGTVVGWQLPTRWETVALALALARLGAVQAPVIHLYRERELRAVLQQSRPSVFVTLPARAGEEPTERVRAAIDPASTTVPRLLALPEQGRWDAPGAHRLPPPPAGGEDARWHYYTSGTASSPKAVLHADRSLMAAGVGMAARLGMTQQDVGSVAYPFAHVGGVAYVAAGLASGMSVVLFDRFEPAAITTSFRRWGVTFAGGSTAHYQGLLAEQRRHPGEPLAPSLKVLAGGGASKPAALFAAVKSELGVQLVHAYGLTESPISTFNSPQDSDEQLACSDGLPVDGMEIRIVSPDGALAAQGETGEIRLRGPNVSAGYLDPALNREAFDADGFLRTGDLGLLRADGRLAVTGRLKDIIIRKGENISAREIEELLLLHPRVRDAAVIGLPDDERGELVCAVVEPADPADTFTFEQMRTHLLAHRLMAQKMPERLEVMATLPRSEALQKVAKQALRERFSR